MKAFTDVAAHRNSVAPGANSDPQGTFAIRTVRLCPFETVAKEGVTPFCSLLSLETPPRRVLSVDRPRLVSLLPGTWGGATAVAKPNRLYCRITLSRSYNRLVLRTNKEEEKEQQKWLV